MIDGDGGEQDFDAEGGDDIMLGGPGIQRSEGMLGFDWVIHEGDPSRVKSDLDFIGDFCRGRPRLRDRFDLVEALSGWSVRRRAPRRQPERRRLRRTGDVPIGAATLSESPASPGSRAADVLPARATSFDAGNIIIGGDGATPVEGRGGDDIIDGDKWLHVYMSVRTDPTDPDTEFRTAESMNDLEADVFSGDLDPGNIVIVREILYGNGAGTDTAMFSTTGPPTQCTDISGATPQPLSQCPREWDRCRLEVTHLGGGGVPDPADPGAVVLANDGTDTVRERRRAGLLGQLPAGRTHGRDRGGGQPQCAGQLHSAGERRRQLRGEVLDATSGLQVGPLRTITDPAITSLLVTGLTNGQTYRFRVRGVNDFGTVSARCPRTR